MTNKQKKFSSRLQELEKEFEHPDDFFRGAYDKMQEDDYEIKPTKGFSKKEIDEMEGDGWLSGDDYEGQLAVDVYEKDGKIVVKAALAGVKPENVDVNLNNDTLTIKGKREKHQKEEGSDYFIEECYWGGFSRSIILPVDVKQDEIEAKFEQGIITITLPISKRSKHTKIEVKEVK